MVEQVKKLLDMQVAEIINSEACMSLLKCYSKLYLSGGQPRSCERSQRIYYEQLQKDGLIMAAKYEESQKRTCVPAWDGLKYISATARHWDGSLLTDSEAVYLLTNGYILESKFIKLPDGYNSKEEPLQNEMKSTESKKKGRK